MRLASSIRTRQLIPVCKVWNVIYTFANGTKRTVQVDAINRRFAIWNAREETGIWTAETITASVAKGNK